MQTSITVFTGLQPEFAAAMQIRTKVFVEEQHVPVELERDEFDAAATHVLLNFANRVVATGRVFHDPKNSGVMRLGRVAVLSEFRGHGFGRLIVEELLRLAAVDAVVTRVLIHAQKSVIGLYARLGFLPVGEEFLEAGIEHQEMFFDINRSAGPSD